jgi:hypothetical protein
MIKKSFDNKVESIDLNSSKINQNNELIKKERNLDGVIII